MRKSAIFDVKQFSMRKIFVLSLIFGLLAYNNIYSQYTESINTYRPGTSQGAFSVGKNVVQGEAGIGINRERHSIFDNKTNGFEFQYLFRAGLIKEQLEFSLQGSYINNRVFDNVGDTDGPFVDSGFPVNTLGVKYLIYDPYKYRLAEKVNIRSWNANKKFNFKKLIPAVSAYVGANFSSKKSDFAFHNNSDNRATKIQSSISPKIVIAAQNNWSPHLVFVTNFVIDKFTTEFPDFRFLFTSTYNFKGKWAVLGEYELANSKIYKDHIFRVGGTYLINNDFQLDASLSSNVKGTPYKFGINAGVSYRMDFHKSEDDERIKTAERKDIEKDIEQIKKDIENGLLDPSVMTGTYRGVDLEEYVENEENIDNFDSIPGAKKQKKKKWWKLGSKGKQRKKAIAEAKNDTISDGTSVSTTKVLGTGGRISDFADDEFLQEKKESIKPKERTPEEQAELDAKIAEREKKKGNKNEPLIDPLTNEPYTEEELGNMSKKEIKKARKEQAELKKLDDELESLIGEVKTEQSAREKARAAKKKAKADRKAAKKTKKTSTSLPTETISQDINSIDDEINKLEKEIATEKEIEEASSKETKAEEKKRLKAEKKEAKEAAKKAKQETKEQLEPEEENSSKW